MLLLAPRQLLFQRGELGEGRVGIDRPLALARIGAGGVGPQRRTGLAVAAIAALVAATVLATALAIAGLALVAVPVLAFEAAALVVATLPALAPLALLAALAEILARSAMAMTLTLLAVGRLPLPAFRGREQDR